jgi:hypothetical protein
MSVINPTITRGPVTVYVAPVATAFTGVLTIGTLDAAWKKLGSRGSRSQGDSGVTVNYSQTIEEFLGQSNVAQDASRTAEGVTVTVELADVSLEALSHAMNENVVTVVAPGASTKGTKKMSIAKGQQVKCVALLIAVKSPYVVGEYGVHYFPKVYNNAGTDLAFTKTSPTMSKFEFKIVEGPAATDDDPDIGYIEIVSAAATS